MTSPTLAPDLPNAQDLSDLPYSERLRRWGLIWDAQALRLQKKLRRATSREERHRIRIEIGTETRDWRRHLLPESATP